MSKIAVIDSKPDILQASSIVLTSRGYEVITATNSEDGYNLVKKENPDLIILDKMISEPDDGFCFAQKIRSENLQTPIIMFTSISKAVDMDYTKSEKVPVDEFIKMPFSPSQLVGKVEKYITDNNFTSCNPHFVYTQISY